MSKLYRILSIHKEKINFFIGFILSVPLFYKLAVNGHEINIPIQKFGQLCLLILLIINWHKINFNVIYLKHKLAIMFIFISILSLTVNYYHDSRIIMSQLISFIHYISLFVVFFIGYFCFREESVLSSLMYGLFIAAGFVSFLILVDLFYLIQSDQLLFKSHQIHNTLLLRNIFLGYPNKLSAELTIIFLLSLAFKSKIILLIEFILVAMLFFAMSKATLIGLSFSFILILYFCRNYISWHRIKILGIYLLILILVCFNFQYFNGDIMSSMAPRMEIKMQLFDSMNKNDKYLITAIGYGYKSAEENLPFVQYGEKKVQFSSAHDQYIEIFLKTGLIGLLFFIGFLIHIMINSVKYMFETKKNDCLSITVICIMVGLFIANLGQENFTTEPVCTLVFLLLGIVDGRLYQELSDREGSFPDNL